ncbi:PREDICTED: histone-lysine N-methyltransferase, H3 lysine-79 specific-like [Priapulus caudatus]|uniref:Histone-lysine N-methyltransferase, H3 lysine-79 specific-like n=1 Tax=Priapulus caudatus TaxID=37621 RepID=A0ABM1F6E5_PRICU|nr:PREDICTED: histone-lysine N-methyltransferase, H3 lysine-79 specific-like [Priapulus caudatus]
MAEIQLHPQPDESLDEPKYACTEFGCSKTFSQPRNLKRHFRTIHGPVIRRYICLYCEGKWMARKDDILRHIRKEHRDQEVPARAEIQSREVPRISEEKEESKETSTTNTSWKRKRSPTYDYQRVKEKKDEESQKRRKKVEIKHTELEKLATLCQQNTFLFGPPIRVEKEEEGRDESKQERAAWAMERIHSSETKELYQKHNRSNMKIARLRIRIGQFLKELEEEEAAREGIRYDLRKSEDEDTRRERKKYREEIENQDRRK